MNQIGPVRNRDTICVTSATLHEDSRGHEQCASWWYAHDMTADATGNGEMFHDVSQGESSRPPTGENLGSIESGSLGEVTACADRQGVSGLNDTPYAPAGIDVI